MTTLQQYHDEGLEAIAGAAPVAGPGVRRVPTIPVSIGPNGWCTVGTSPGVHLTRKEAELLRLILLAGGSVVSKDQALSAMYQGSDADEPEVKIIDVFVCKLRKKFDWVGHKAIVETIWGRGHCAGPGYGLAEEAGVWLIPVSTKTGQLLHDVAAECDTAPGALAEKLLADAIRVHRARIWQAGGA